MESSVPACQKSPLDIFDKLLSQMQNGIKGILILHLCRLRAGY